MTLVLAAISTVLWIIQYSVAKILFFTVLYLLKFDCNEIIIYSVISNVSVLNGLQRTILFV